MFKLFLSYTTKDKEITIELLKAIKNRMEGVGLVYIHLLDDKGKTLQEMVIKELHNSDVMILLETSKVKESKWVQIELNYAEKVGIPILKTKITDLLSLNKDELKKLIIKSYNIRKG